MFQQGVIKYERLDFETKRRVFTCLHSLNVHDLEKRVSPGFEINKQGVTKCNASKPDLCSLDVDYQRVGSESINPSLYF